MHNTTAIWAPAADALQKWPVRPEICDRWLQEANMTCLLNYLPHEQPELQWLAAEAAIQHSWAEECHKSLFSSQTGYLKDLRLAQNLQDTLWAMSMVRSRTFSDKVT